MLTRVGVPVEYEAEPSAQDPQPTTLLCFSHLRWDFVFQRPQHLMSRFAREMNVIYWEEPVNVDPSETAYLKVRGAGNAPGLSIVTPHLPEGMPDEAREAALTRLLDAHVASLRGALIAWYYTPMMLTFSRDLDADLTIFDAMDELSKFKFAPTHLLELEQEAGGQIQSVREQGYFVGLSVVIGVFENFNTVARFSAFGSAQGIFVKLEHPQTAALIPGHCDRIDDVGFRGKQTHVKTWQHDEFLLRLGRGQRVAGCGGVCAGQLFACGKQSRRASQQEHDD